MIINIFEKRNINKETFQEIITPKKSIAVKTDTFSIETEKGDTLMNQSDTLKESEEF
jgi:hypothetical protein